MSLNTAIRGAQIQDGAVDSTQLANDGVTNDKLANIAQGFVKVGGGSNAPTDLDAKTDGYILIGDGTDVNSVVSSGDVTVVNTGAFTIGATKVTDAMINDDVATGLAGVGLVASSGVLAVDLYEVGEVAVDVANDSFALMDNSDTDDTKRDTIADLITAIAGSGLTATSGVLSVDAVTDNIVESDILFENESANCDDVTTDFTLAQTPIVNSVQVCLNGLLQEDGSGKDYTLSGTTVSFATAPLTGDILLIHYIQNN